MIGCRSQTDIIDQSLTLILMEPRDKLAFVEMCFGTECSTEHIESRRSSCIAALLDDQFETYTQMIRAYGHATHGKLTPRSPGGIN